MSRLASMIAVASLFLFATGWAQAGVYVSTGIGITTSSVLSNHYMDVDSTTAYWYDVQADGYIWRDSTVVKSATDTGNSAVDLALSTSASSNRVYQAQTNHWVVAYYWYVSGSTTWYYDPSGFGLISASSYGGDGTIYGSGRYNEVLNRYMYIASGYISDNTYAPSIGGINMIGSPTPGGSGYIEVYGSNLAKWAGSTTW